jgi:hypothetical protein
MVVLLTSDRRVKGNHVNSRGQASTGMDLRSHHERRRPSIIGILALIAVRALSFGGSRNGLQAIVPAALPASARRERPILNHTKQQQNKHDQHYQAKTTTTVVADSRAHAIAAESEHQQQDK